ncbi:SoxR reducing system RseC family protein [Anaerosphaera multitolerans]|uniref:Fis family transcriptional regulator n=1 Tax=Anaerosphaera multitolerans TaxID=2487351 RepID=A0A437S846_9FIRM|nr:SoxR reducing system RseC family protein [Anaerosphaera multitolerans]RVU55259.1 Fis family transcriptional regulator [Anaerosphaera multitolerans]
MEQDGYVIKDLGEYVEISVMRESACGSNCETCQAKCSESKPFNLKVPNTLNLKVGERVKIEMNSKMVISYILLVYGLPLVFLLLGTLIGIYVFSKMNLTSAEILAFGLGLIVMSMAYLIIKRVDAKHGENKLNEISIKRY